MKLTNTTPNHDGFRMVAEFEPQQSSYLIWPERQDNWRNGGKPVQKVFTELAKTIAKFQPVTMLVNQDQYINAKDNLDGIARVVEMSSDDAWAKDTLPIYVKKQNKIRAVDFSFNAWGGVLDGLFFPWDKDNMLGAKIADLNEIDYYSSDIILDGCAILTDGDGTILTTEDVLLAEDRNPNVTRSFMENVLKEYLGAKKVILLKHGYLLDETGGDIDNIVNFVGPANLVLTWTDNREDPLYEVCREAYDILSHSTDALGRKFKITKMPIPSIQKLTKEETEGLDLVKGLMPRSIGQRLTATYVSFITLNNAIIYPTFDDPQDEIAEKTFKSLFPNKQIIGFPVREILIGGGGLHAIINNLPY